MKKNQIWRNNSSGVNISVLKDKLVGQRTIIVSSLEEDFKYDLSRYFDIIIADSPHVLKKSRADICIDVRTTPYTNHVMDCRCHENYPETIFCMQQNALRYLQKSKRRLESYVLAYDVLPVAPSSKILKKSEMKIAISKNNPALHLALIGGATEIYTTSRASIGVSLSPQQLVEFIEKKGVYGIPVNLKHKNRKSLIQTWS